MVAFLTRSDRNRFKETPYQFRADSDINQYYSYLPAYVIHDDISFEFPNNYWLTDVNGAKVPKMTFGMAIMYSPFFLASHAYAKTFSYDISGYSLPYSVGLKIGTYFYITLALYLLFGMLRIHFSTIVSAIAIGAMVLGTNLYYYIFAEGEMSHAYLFFLFTLIIYCTIKWYSIGKSKFLFGLSLAIGLSILIRPTSVIVILFPLLYQISSLQDFRNRMNLIIQKKVQICIATLLVILPFFLQMCFWKIQTGQWFVWSYQGEHFYFSNPHIWEFLFGFRKGWFIYTPLMFFIIIGLFFINKQLKSNFRAIPLILILAIFILSSWWCWWFGGSFGSRSMIDFYPFLIFPLATIINMGMISRTRKMIMSSVLLLIIGYTYVLQKKYPNGLHWDAMTKDAFFITMGYVNDLPPKAHILYEQALDHPNYENARKGK